MHVCIGIGTEPSNADIQCYECLDEDLMTRVAQVCGRTL